MPTSIHSSRGVLQRAESRQVLAQIGAREPEMARLFGDVQVGVLVLGDRLARQALDQRAVAGVADCCAVGMNSSFGSASSNA